MAIYGVRFATSACDPPRFERASSNISAAGWERMVFARGNVVAWIYVLCNTGGGPSRAIGISTAQRNTTNFLAGFNSVTDRREWVSHFGRWEGRTIGLSPRRKIDDPVLPESWGWPEIVLYDPGTGSSPSILSFMSLTCSGECRCQSVHSPLTRRSSCERYDSVGFTPSFVRLGSAMMGLIGSTM